MAVVGGIDGWAAVPLLQSKAPHSGTSLLCLIPSPSLGLWRGVLGDSAATPKHGEGGGTQNGDSLQPGRGGKVLGWEQGCAPVPWCCRQIIVK